MIRIDSGVYYIVNNETGCVYVGSTISAFKYRWNVHRKNLNNGNHINQYLQNSWNKHGETAFTFKIAEECEPDICIQKEQEHIDRLKCDGTSLYNICPVAGHPFRGRKHTEEWKKQMSERTKAYYDDPIEGENRRNASRQRIVSEETRKKLSEATKAHFSNIDNRKARYDCTDETKEKISKIKTNYFNDPILGEERRKKAGNGKRGVPMKEETKNKLRDSHLGKTVSDETKKKISEGWKRFRANAEMIDTMCQYCKEAYQSLRPSKFCSEKCKECARHKRRYKKKSEQ